MGRPAFILYAARRAKNHSEPVTDVSIGFDNTFVAAQALSYVSTRLSKLHLTALASPHNIATGPAAQLRPGATVYLYATPLNALAVHPDWHHISVMD